MTNSSIYVGPYILVKNKQVTRVVTERIHPVTGKKYAEHWEYCPVTGAKLEKVETTLTFPYYFSHFEAKGLDEDKFFSPPYPDLDGVQLFLLVDNEQMDYFDSEKDDNGYQAIDLTNQHAKYHLDTFFDENQPYLDHLKNNNWEYTIHFGVVSYGH